MSTIADVKEAIREYWEADTTVSIIDENLHEIEIDIVRRHLQPTDYVADIGSGDGSATVRYADSVKQVLGIERSDRLRSVAEQRAAASGKRNIAFAKGDILDLDAPDHEFDAVVTQRMLINLASWEDQMRALRTIHRVLKPGGRLIMIENTNDGMLALNDMRARVGLKPIPQHWHNRFFDYEDLTAFLRGKFQVLNEVDLGLYYLLTRVYVPMFASFTGWGANAVKDSIFEQSDAAARRMFELFNDSIGVKGCRVLGPIQAFILRREATDL